MISHEIYLGILRMVSLLNCMNWATIQICSKLNTQVNVFKSLVNCVFKLRTDLPSIFRYLLAEKPGFTSCLTRCLLRPSI